MSPERDDWPAGTRPAAGEGSEERAGDTEPSADESVLEALQRRDTSPRQPIRAVVPTEALGDGTKLSELLGSVVAEYEEIERALAALRPGTGEWQTVPESSIAFITEAELLDPVSLERALAPLQSESLRFEFLFAQARRALERLDGYGLSRRGPHEVVELLADEEQLRSLQYVVEFLVSLQSAADTFEEINLPRPHIRDYLEHLYRMEDWREMGRLVRMLELAVQKCLRVQDDGAGEESLA